MRAVYQSIQAYLSLPYGEVNNHTTVMSEGYYDKQGRYIEPDVVGAGVIQSFTMDKETYTFKEGEDHNQLTLVNPREIRNMREYIKRRGVLNATIREILFDGNEADLEEPVESVKQEEPVKKTLVERKRVDGNEFTDWDIKLLGNMIRR